ncbi:MAG: PspA/IM30 family protein [Pseudomonadota bacterium]
MTTKSQNGGRRKAQADATAPTETPGVSAPEPSALWRRLVTAVRGGVNELGEVIAESQALRILDQEIRDNDDELHRVRANLSETMAHCKVAQERLAAADARLEEYEGYALKALKSGEDALVREIAAKISLLEIERDGHAKRAGDYAAGIVHLRKVVAQLEGTINRLKQQVDTVRATENVQRAQAAVANRREGSDVRVRTALDSLERIKRRQAERGAQFEVAETMSEHIGDDALDAKLRRAGIIADEDRTEAVLSRLKKRHDA